MQGQQAWEPACGSDPPILVCSPRTGHQVTDVQPWGPVCCFIKGSCNPQQGTRGHPVRPVPGSFPCSPAQRGGLLGVASSLGSPRAPLCCGFAPRNRFLWELAFPSIGGVHQEAGAPRICHPPDSVHLLWSERLCPSPNSCVEILMSDVTLLGGRASGR